MKTFRFASVTVLFLSFFGMAFSQDTKEESFKVSGNCGMCKNKIEGAAKTAGATYADWNKDSKELTIKYNTNSTNAAKVQQKIAEAGYDTPSFKATKEAYDKLPQCCHYTREGQAAAKCCDNAACGKEGGKCTGMDCCKDGKCTKKGDMAEMDCCKNGKCEKHS